MADGRSGKPGIVESESVARHDAVEFASFFLRPRFSQNQENDKGSNQQKRPNVQDVSLRIP